MDRFICIHGHFYQPPRENPWLESVELQDSAFPYHDWNERITSECYAPNATARILSGHGQISEITSNYSKISFNFGPTLLAWMKDKMPGIHDAIIDADVKSRERFSGHGSAIAQVYNHMILPLANTRDRQTQVIWGIRDFESRFGRKPEGMWLAETAADTETLDTLAQQGIKYTILSPFQASRVREIGKRNWKDINGGRIDPTRPYLMKLKSGRTMALFFYDAPVSQAIAFEHLLSSGESLAQRLTSAFNDSRQWDQLVHIATDGESYGHHHRHGEMALAYALHFVEQNNLAKLTVYGEYLEKHPPTHEVQIHEKSAWSCSHGVRRWMEDCGCNSGGHAGWNQGWRTPLRQSLDWLRDQLAGLFEQKAGELLRDPWGARNEYISVILDRSPESRAKFIESQARRQLNEAEQVQVFKLMELQRHAMLMYTSCGWFFDEISGIESVQVVQYAARAIQLAQDLFGKDLEPGFLEIFQGAKSNLRENGDGRRIYEKFVKPAMIDWPKATAHYAISSIFQQYDQSTRLFSFHFSDEDRHLLTSGKTRLALGRVKIDSEITQETQVFSYGILYMGEHNVTGGVRQFESSEAYDKMVQEIKAAYEASDFPETIRAIDRHFGGSAYSLKSLFKDEQRRILNEIMATTREDLESRFRLITERYEPLVKFMQGAGMRPPAALETVFDLVLHEDIRREITADPINFERLGTLIDNARGSNGRVLDADVSFTVKNRMEQIMELLRSKPDDLAAIGQMQQLAEIVCNLPLGLNLWKVQNLYWEMMQQTVPEFRQRAQNGDGAANEWLNQFAILGEKLGFDVNAIRAQGQPVELAA
jgi:alpha-amylase/alpha-mannosidase (GH57 family)